MIAFHPGNPKSTPFLLLVLASLIPLFTNGQSYTVSQSGTYYPETSNPTDMGLIQDGVVQIPIGFNFTFFGQTYTDCYVGGDGFITFGSDPGEGYCCGQELPDPALPNNLIAVAWSNMDYTVGTYEVFGDAPYRRLVISFDLTNSCDQLYIGQVKLFESTNVIEIHTQQWDQDQCGASTQGLENADGTEAIVVPGRNYDDTWQVNYGDEDFVSFTPSAPAGNSYTVTHGGIDSIEIIDPTYVYFGEDDSYEIPIGFDFDFFGQPYSNCWVGSDGFVAFGDYPGGGCCGQAIPDVNPLNNLIAVAWTNMDWHSIHYEIFGDAPYRRLVITFDLTDVCSTSYYGQVKLYETTNVIELFTQQWGDGQAPCNNTTQGIENADGTGALYWAGRNFNTDWTVADGDNDIVTFTPSSGGGNVTYIVDEPNDFNLEFVSPIDVTITADSAVNVPIGFDFSFFGNTYSSCYLDFYGFLSFTPTSNGCCEGQIIPDPAGPNNIIAPGWIGATNDDCCYNNEGYDIFSYETLGDAPNRRFIAYFLLPEDCGQYYTGEVKLFEGTNIIEIHTDQWAAYNTPCHNATQGIENLAGTAAFYKDGRVANTDWSVVSGTNDVVRFTPFLIPPFDAGVNQVYSGPFCAGDQPMACLISNYGLYPIDSVMVEWEFDGVPQTPVNYQSSMPAGGTNFVVNLDTINLVFGQTHTLKAWTSMPNGGADENNSNDTMMVNVLVGMNGERTIGGTNPDYNSFHEALADLQNIGVCDTTIFNVRPGTYNEHIVIPDIPGSIVKQVIFQAENGDSSSVVLQYNATSVDSNYVVRFNYGHNVVLRNMTLNALGTNYATVLDLQATSNSNSIEHCAINGKNVSSTAAAFFCINSGSYNFNNRFYRNTIKNGSTGFYHHDSPADTNPTQGLSFIENTFLDFADKGVATSETQAIQIQKNTFQSSVVNARAIDIDVDNDSMLISGNKIYLPSGSYGMEITNVDAPANRPSRIYNNMIMVPGSSVYAGLSVAYSDHMNIYDNSIRVSTSVSGRYAFFHSSGIGVNVYNNVFTNMGGGLVMYGDNFFQNDFDYNDLYTTGPLLGYFGGYWGTLNQWIIGTGFDEHSVSVDPFFTSSTDLHVINSFLNAKGTSVLSDSLDFDGDNRNANTPDIGADEFVPVATDVAITSILSPTISCAAEQNIEIVLANLGADTLDHVTIQYTINGEAQPDYLFNTGLLPEGDTAHVVIVSHTFSNQPDSLRIWTSMPNDVADLQHVNDTIATSFRLPLQGVYTIGGTTPDFTTIGDAVKALNRYFTCGPVDFKIRDGIYTEQIEVDSIPTVSAVNTITFESESMDSSAVTIQFTPGSNTHPAVFMLKGTDYVTFRNLGIKSQASSWADGIELRYNAKHITITHCYFDIYVYGSSSIAVKSLCFNNPNNEYLTIDHNYFLNGQQAVYLYNCGNRNHDIHIEDNILINQLYTGMDLSFPSGLYIRNNFITTNSANYGKAIDLSSADGTVEISGNIMNLSNGDGMFLDGINFSTYQGASRVFNNMIKTAGSGGGIRLWNCEGTLVAYNSCNMTGSGPAFEAAGGDSLTVKNNILVSNTGKAFGSFSWTPHMLSDYNDLLTTSGNIGFWHDTLYATFTDWKNGTHFDSNSMSITPQFVSSTDLHILADTLDGAGIPIAGITTDIDNNPRNANTPDIGADEIGANDNDAGVFAILPEMPFARGMQPVKAVVRNYGGNTLTSVDVYWKLNNVVQTTFNYSGSIPTLQQDTVTLGVVDFSLSTPYDLKAWTAQPNSTIDYYNSNDTLTALTRYAAVSDTVTIGGSMPDVPTIAAAYTALSLGGVLDSVHFQLRSGTYHAPMTIGQTIGMNCSTPIIFEAESGNASDVIWDNTGINGTTILLDGADGVQFRNLTIRTVLPAYHAVEFRSSATCNTFLNCKIEGVTTTSTSTTQAVVYSNSGGCNNNRFIGNMVSKGSYNIYWAGDFQTTGALLQNNHFQDAYYNGVFLSWLKAPVVNGNILTVSNIYAYFYGIYLNQCDLDVQLTGNQILMDGKRGIGLVVNACHGSSTQKMLIANNFVIIGNGDYSYGIQHAYCDYANIYYNTVRVTGGNGSGIGYYRPYGTNLDIRNNIFDNQASGPAMYFAGNEGPLTSDYNDLLTSGANLVYKGGTYYTDLEDWKVTDLDTNSVTEDPMYVSSEGYAITSAALNAIADPVSEVTTDIEGDSRDTLTPDIGCDEFYLATNDVGLLSISYPKEPFPSGDNTIFIKFVNNGQDTLTTMQVDWEVDGNMQPTYMWMGLLPSAGTYDSLDIGVYNFAPYQFHTIKVWVSEPNGVQDGLASNDTLAVDSLYPGLMGVYTIGGSNPDFDSISIAEYHLNNGGAAGPVTFNIRTGTYLETINLIDYPGSDCNRPVIFQSETGDSSSVIIKNLGIDDNIVSLNGTDGVIFQHLTLQSVNPAFRNVISYNSGANCNQFLNDQIIGYNGTSNSSTDAVIMSATSLDTANVFENNLIQYGSIGLYLVGNGAPSHTKIENNFLDHNYYHGIYASSESAIRILHNLFQGGPQSSYTSIYLEYCHGDNQIISNDVQGIMGSHMLDIEGCYASNSARGIIANNFFSALPSFGINGVVIDNSRYYDFIFNNINVTSNSPSTAFYFHSDSSLYIANNVITNSGAGQAVYGNNQAVFTSDYNDIYGAQGFGQWNGAGVANLSAWQSATGQDSHSQSVNPQYMSGSNLHVSNILLNGTGVSIPSVTTDIEGNARNVPPDIGADEFNPAIADDAGIFSYYGPNAPFAPGSNPVSITLKNYGFHLLTSADIHWVVNGIEQPVYHWTGSLASAICDTIAVGNFNFPEHTGHEMSFWSEIPNGVPDSTHVNDTLAVTDIYPALNGTYTVGGVLPDFNLFSEIESSLNKGGILGNVIFNVRNGTYAAQFEIQNFPRTSYSHLVTFQSESGDSSQATIVKNFYQPDNNYTVRLSNAHNIEFKKLTVSSTQGRVLDISDGSSLINIHNNHLVGPEVPYADGTTQVVYSATTTEDTITIQQNRIEHGEIGIMLQGSGGNTEKEITILKNTILNPKYRGINTVFSDHLKISGNTVLCTTNSADGIVLTASYNTREISSNDIRLMLGGQYGINLYDVRGTTVDPALIANNYILMKNYSSASYGIIQGYGDHNNFYYNTVRMENPNSYAFYDYSPYQQIHIRNCIFACPGGGLTMYNNWYTGYTTNTMDYCDLYTTGPVLAYYASTNFANLAALQAGNPQNQNSVSAEPLFTDDSPAIFQAMCDAHATPIPTVTTDIHDQARSATTPDIGAVEFTLPPHDIGAKLLTNPHTYCGLSAAEAVTIRIQNYGANAETGFDVAYSFNGSNWHIENVGSLSVTPGGTADYTFSTTEDLSQPGTYHFSLYTDLNSDLNHPNDTIWNIAVQHIPALVNPVTNLIPVSGTIDLNQTVSLSWAPAPNATKYDIYIWPFGDTEPSLPVIPDLISINTLYSNLNYGVEYNWKVVAKNVCNQMVPSTIQQFTVRNLPDLVIDTVIAPSAAFSGQQVQIDWQVKNMGPGATQSQLWSDAVYLSTDATLNISFDTYLGAVQNLTALDSGIVYTNTGQFTIPNGFVGNYYVFIYADRWNSLIEGNNNNNWDRTSAPIMISLTPAPDLVVDQVTTPTTAFSGVSIPVTYIIRNQGSGSVAENQSWTDRFVFGQDPLNAIGDVLSNSTVSQQLLPDSTYEITKMVTLPQAISGTYYMHVVTDANNSIYEFAAENNNQGASLPITVVLSPPADLVVSSITFPDTVSNNQIFNVGWTVMNNGAGPASSSYWLDQVSFSASPVYNTNFLIPISNVYKNGPVIPFGNYTQGQNVYAPQYLSGLYYVYAYTDKDNNVFEYNLENNNIFKSPQQIFVANPDLVSTDLTAPDTVMFGSSISFSCMFRNQGLGHMYYSNPTFKIYLSDTNTINAQSVLLSQSNFYLQDMKPQDSLFRNATLNLPPGLLGNYYIIVQVDANNYVFEGAEEGNNQTATPIYLQPGPVPDIKTSLITTQDTITAGMVSELQYVYSNIGTATVQSNWTDKVYLSFSPTWNPSFATELKSVDQLAGLAPGVSRNTDLPLLIPQTTTENVYYFYVVNDVLNTIFEGIPGNANNITRSDSVYIKAAPPIDLSLDTLTVSQTTLYTGFNYPFQWTTKNVGSSTTLTEAWSDRIYLSTDTILQPGFDILVTDKASVGALLQPGLTRNQNASLMIPEGLSGQYYIIGVTDALDVHMDVNRDNNVDLVRDVNGDPVACNIILSPSPNLGITLFNTPATAIAGQPLQFIYTITNTGNGAATTWIDKLYLSADNTISSQDPVLLSNSRVSLNPGNSITDTVDVQIPVNYFGNYILILQTDANNQLYEYNGEDNNILSRSINIINPPPSDLHVSSVVVPISVIAGENIDISWTTENIGSNPASGVFREIAYVSQDTTWTTDDVLFGFKDQTVYLSPGGHIDEQLTDNVTGIATGDYYAIVQTDARQNFNESNEDNNFSSSAEVMNVDVKRLYLDSLTLDTLHTNLELYYKLIVGPELDGETILLDLKGDSINGHNELYVKLNQMPTRANFDYGFDQPFASNQRVIIPSVHPGVYYILVYGFTSNQSLQPISLYAKTIDYEILALTPKQGIQNTQVTLKITGTKLLNTSYFELRRSQPWLSRLATSSLIVNDNLAFATFDLTDIPIDTFAIDLVKADSSLAFIDDFMVVPDGSQPKLQINAQLPGAVSTRPSPIKIILTFINNGDADVINPAIRLEAPYGNKMSMNLEDLQNGEDLLIIPLVEENGPPGVIRPGASGRIEVYASSGPVAVYGIRLND